LISLAATNRFTQLIRLLQTIHQGKSGAHPRIRGRLEVPNTVKLPVLKEAPPLVHVLRKPEVVHIATNGRQYLCGHCGALLLVAHPSQLTNIAIECRECGALNDARI
jgi:DNA-directed RNA polymerase subunit RPC12/RpoP